jgi:hypothetical protein
MIPRVLQRVIKRATQRVRKRVTRRVNRKGQGMTRMILATTWKARVMKKDKSHPNPKMRVPQA